MRNVLECGVAIGLSACFLIIMIMIQALSISYDLSYADSEYREETEEEETLDYCINDLENERNLNLSQIVEVLKDKYDMTNNSEERKQVIVELKRIVKSIEKRAFDRIRAHNESAIAVLVLACNRVSISRCLNSLLKFRPSAQQFPIIVSQDCFHVETTNVIKSFGDRIFYMKHHAKHLPPETEPSRKWTIKGYAKISKHYIKALNKIFFEFGFSYAIVVEDDLEISPDFYEYFLGTLPILKADPTLFCVSAWNDNGLPEFIQRDAPEVLYRTDFFPGLGWMLSNTTWVELAPNWPKTFWDDWIRRPEQMKGRACIRPEISRTKTFGADGVSGDTVYYSYLKYTHLNDVFVPFTQLNLTYLLKQNYDLKFFKSVCESPQLSSEDLIWLDTLPNSSVRVLLLKDSFPEIAGRIGISQDLTSGVARTGYKEIVSVFYKSCRIYLGLIPSFAK